MKISIAAATLAAFATTAASAADLPRRTDAAPPAPVFTAAPAFSWTGFYVGVNGGYGFGGFTRGGDPLFGNASGGLVGGTLGYNQQFGSAVLGLEGDWGWSGIRGSSTLAGPALASSRLTNLMTARLRAGYSIDRALLFVSGGYAGGTLRSSLIDATLPPGSQSFTTSNWNNGFALGLGAEYAFTKNVSAKFEYLHVGLADKPIFAPPRATTTGLQSNILRAGVNYRF